MKAATRLGVLVLAVAAFAACGKSKTPEEKNDTASTAAAPVAADSALAELPGAGLAGEIASRGFRVVQARRFPAQLAGRRAAVLVYRAGDGPRGGVVYVTRTGDAFTDRIAWHWYFADMAPDSVAPAELNADGLWDMRVYASGRTIDLIQGDSFTLMSEAGGVVARNGASSAAQGVWKLFDGDAKTAWEPAANAFLELPNPFGLKERELVVSAPAAMSLALYSGDTKVQDVSVDGSQAQTVALDPALGDAASIRVVVQGKGAISELEIR